MHVLLSFLKWGSIGYSLGIVQWDFTRRDHPGNPRRVFESGLVIDFLLLLFFSPLEALASMPKMRFS